MRYARGVRLDLLLLLAAAPLVGCINTDAAIFVAPTLDAPAVAVKNGALGTSVSGAFHLELHLGPRASGPSTVTLGQFDILDAQQAAAIVSPLALTSTPPFPVTVQPGSDVDLSLTFDTGTKLLGADLGKKLCDAAGIVIGGRIEDSLLGTATPVASGVLHASCQ